MLKSTSISVLGLESGYSQHSCNSLCVSDTLYTSYCLLTLSIHSHLPVLSYFHPTARTEGLKSTFADSLSSKVWDVIQVVQRNKPKVGRPREANLAANLVFACATARLYVSMYKNQLYWCRASMKLAKVSCSVLRGFKS